MDSSGTEKDFSVVVVNGREPVLSVPEAESLLRRGFLYIVDNPTGKKSTVVWKKFGLLKSNDSDKLLPFAACTDCNKVYTFKSAHKSGTSSLHRHLYEQCVAETSRNGQKRMTHFFKKPEEKKPTPTAAKEELAEACVAFTAKDLRAFNIAAGEGFLALITAAVSIGRRFDFSLDFMREVIPHRTTVSRRLGEKADEVRALIRPELQAVFGEGGDSGGITLDGWKEIRTQTDYIGLTVHYFFDWKLIERCLLMTEFDSGISKTGENIRTFIIKQLLRYGIKEKMCQNALFVTDAGSSMVKAFNLPRALPMTRITCSCHRINTVLSDMFNKKYVKDNYKEESLHRMEVLYRLIQESKELVEYFKRTALMKQLKKSLKQQCPTRWNSHVAMLESIQDEYSNIQTILESRKEIPNMPGPESLLADLIVFLKPFKSATDDLSASNVPTMHLVVPLFKKLKLHCQVFQSEHPSLLNLSSMLVENFEKKFILKPEHKIACFLHPPYRRLKMFDSAERIEVLGFVRTMIPLAGETSAATESIAPAKRKSSAFDFSDYEDMQDAGSDVDEVSRYHELICQNNVGDAIEFWKSNEKDFPRLSKLARKYLAVPAASTASERLFSKAGFVIDDERTSLSADKADDILFLYSNRDKF